MITLRFLHDVGDLVAVPDLEMRVWGSSGRETVPTHMLLAILHSGGSLVGAYDGTELVGFALALLARRESDSLIWSHMAGIHPDYQSQGLGFRLKQAQRNWALSQGYTLMGWTYDPLLRPNANFNLRRLGASAVRYHIDYYGTMLDGINAGLPSDRVEVDWQLDSQRVSQHAQGYVGPLLGPGLDSPFILSAGPAGHPQLNLQQDGAPWLRAEIPFDLATLKQQDMGLALAWRMALREALQYAFAQGYELCDFEALLPDDSRRCAYLLRPAAS